MAETSLRSYSKDVESLIELDRLDEAIAHCRHVLQVYPKYIDFYRLLGKAYLEAKRYGDASDIFQRVLSAEPRDYVAHVAMSVIREDEGNLDSALWHMERAFETNPANQVIQQELKRLFGIRDSIEPMKIRLTRGALAHMYANGDLYPQAIAELNAALEEDPNRPDLQVLLAEMYWRTNDPQKAAELCSKILTDLPHCLTANRVMAAVMQSDGKSDNGAVYLRRLAALDPYTAFIESAMDDVARVEDESITIEKLEYIPGEDISDFLHKKPDWTSSLREELAADEEPEEDSASWQDIVSTSATAPSDETEQRQTDPFTQDVPQDDASIPEWMRDVGWNEAEGEIQEERLSFSDEELASLEHGMLEEDEIKPAEIPEWLQDMAPPETDMGEASAQDGDPLLGSGTLPGWLKGVTEELRSSSLDFLRPQFEEEETDAPVEEPEPEEVILDSEIPEGEGQVIPSWLDGPEPGASETIIGWLGERTTQEEAADSEVSESETPASDMLPQKQADISWLDGIAEAAALEKQEEDTKGLDRLREISTEAEPSMEEDESTFIPEEPPTWLREISEEFDEETLIQRLPQEADFDLETVDEEEESLPTSESPSWVQSLASETLETEAPPDSQDMVGWQPEFDPSKITRPLGPLPDDSESPEDGIEDLLPETEAPPDLTDLVGWQQEFDPSKVTRPLELPPEDEEALEPEIPDQESIDRLRHLAEVISETTPPEDHLDDFPDTPAWLHEMSVDVPSMEVDEDDETITQKLFKEVERLTKPTEILSEEEMGPEGIALEDEILEPVSVESPGEAAIPGELEPIDASVDAEPTFVEAPEEAEIPGELEPIGAPVDAEPILAEAPEEVEIPGEVEPVEMEAVSETEHPTTPPKPAPSPKLTEKDAASLLQSAWSAARAGDIQTAAQVYGMLVKGRYLMPKVIESLQKALELHPDASSFWKVLGDAHMKADRLSEAMKAYQRGLKRV